jgi:dienelactone hydrolase
VVFLPPGDSYQAGYPSRRIDIRRYDVDFLVREGRALVWPIIWGTHERHVPPPPDGSPMQRRAWQLAVDRRRNEVGRVIDYLTDSPEFDGDEVGLMAASFGGTFVAAPLLAAEPRLKYAVLMATDLAPLVPEQTPDHVNPNTYWPHVSQPVLLMRGEFDIVATSSPHERQLARVLAAREPAPTEVTYPVAHWPLPARLVRRDVLAWLDRQPARMTAQTRTPK